MSRDLLLLLPLAALCLWLTLFLFTVIDHTVHRLSFGRFLRVLERLQSGAARGPAYTADVVRHMRGAKLRYLATYVSRAGSSREPARIASEVYLDRVGEPVVIHRAANQNGKRLRRRVTALYALARTGHPAVLAPLEQALSSGEPVLAYAALDMLDICDSVESAEVLVRCIEAGVLPASRIATHLEHFRIDLNPLYVARLSGEDSTARYWIAYLLGKSSYSAEAEGVLVDLLSDPEPGVRKIALASLGSLGAPCVQARAQSMLDDPAFFVRTQAVRLLAGFPQRDVIRALVPMLADSNDAVQLAAKKSLVAMGPTGLQYIEGERHRVDQAIGAQLDQVTGSIRNAHYADRVTLSHV